MFLRKLLAEHRITQTKLARHIGVQIGVINQICQEKRGISPMMAIRLAQAMGTSPDFWLNLQIAFELGKQRAEPNIRPLVKVA
jgi:addiction module HigA family antidote